MKLTQEQMRMKTKIFLKEIWGIDLNAPVEISGKMTNTLGYVRINSFLGKYRPTLIKYAKSLTDGRYTEETIDNVILHECTHYALCVLGRPFRDGDFEFKKEILRIGSHLTHTIAKVSDHHTVCAKCGKKTGTYETFDKAMKKVKGNWISKCCKSELKYSNQKMEDTVYEIKTNDPNVLRAVQLASVTVKKQVEKKVEITVAPKIMKSHDVFLAIRFAVQHGDKAGYLALKKAYPKFAATAIKYLKPEEQNIIINNWEK